MPWSPTVLLAAGVTSGDRDPDDDLLETYRSPNPNLRFSGATTRLGPGNLWGASPGFAIHPMRSLTLSGSGKFFWRTSQEDATYTAIGFPQRVAATEVRSVGSGGSLLLLWMPDEYLKSYTMGEVFVPGPYLRASPPAETSYFVTTGMYLQF